MTSQYKNVVWNIKILQFSIEGISILLTDFISCIYHVKWLNY